LFEERGAAVSYHDPHVPKIPSMRHYKVSLESVPLTEEAIRESDLVLIATAHSAFDYPWIVRHARLVVDTRNATSAVTEGREKIIRA
ncbi:MAG: nucleotide sugar dehydrogenase, partial [Planctomycetota bacterium]|nr:nucleotide sugar dehydrogenase [Planctomycetota bacterium]